jgi:hypothetical protein
MKKQRQLPSQSYLMECFDYSELTGNLTWKVRPVNHFKSGYRSAEGCANNWNSKMAGKQAFTTIAKTGGYFIGTLDGSKGIKAHRVIWKLIYGEDPVGKEIDHINGNPKDNRIENLRLVDRSENAANLAIQKRSKSGVHGVRWWDSSKKWRVTITRDKKWYHIGMFENLEDAIEARKKAEAELGFHANHGAR